MMPNRIVVLGGNTVYRQGDPEGGGFTSRLRAWHERERPETHRVFNLGVEGDALAEMLMRGPREAAVRRPDLIFLYPGLNDMRRVGRRNSPPQTSPQAIEQALVELIVALKAVAPLAIMSAVPPDEARTCPIWGKWYFTSEDAEHMTQMVARASREAEVPYLPLFERWKNRTDMSELLADGLHCNSRGHECLFQEVRQFDRFPGDVMGRYGDTETLEIPRCCVDFVRSGVARFSDARLGYEPDANPYNKSDGRGYSEETPMHEPKDSNPVCPDQDGDARIQRGVEALLSVIRELRTQMSPDELLTALKIASSDPYGSRSLETTFGLAGLRFNSESPPVRVERDPDPE